MLSRFINFINKDIWHIQSRRLPPGKSFLLRIVRTIILALRGFHEDKVQIRASALTFFSLLAVVPVAAMAFAIAKGFGLDALLEKQLLFEFPAQKEIVLQVIDFARNMLAKTRGGTMAVIGVVVLFWAVIKVLGHIERSFNAVWAVKKSRSLWRKFSDYFTIMLICPLLVISSSTFTVYLKSQLSTIIAKISLLGYLSPLIYLLLNLLPYGMIWVLFTLTYLFMPNTKVKFRSGFLAGIIAGTLYQFLQLAYINFQFLISGYNAIYGSFAALPLFLIWLQASWIIVLFGAEISYAYQNSAEFEFEPGSLNISYATQKLLSLQVVHLLVQNFSAAKKPLTDSQISAMLDLPLRLVQMITGELVAARILSETEAEAADETAYQPALDIDKLTISYILDALEDSGDGTILPPQTDVSLLIKTSLDAFRKTIDSHPANKRLRDI